jgi:signal transduction histidine kinase
MGRDRTGPGGGRTAGEEPAAPVLTFPDPPRIELDQLLGQLVERAQEVMHTQGRLRGLLRANQTIIGELSLPAALRRIVEAARELVGARYAALGVLAPDGGLAEFVHAGTSPGDPGAAGDLPGGEGLLGAAVDDPRSVHLVDLVALEDLGDDGRSSGSRSPHPPVGSFLGVPIRVRGEVFGNLYLSESTSGRFTSEDEELTRSLAATAGVVIDNARLYQSARTRGEWLQASAAITRQLLAADSASPLHLVAETSREIAGADLVVVALPDGQDGLIVEVAVGAGADVLAGQHLPRDGSLAGQVLATGQPLRLASSDASRRPEAVAAARLETGPLLMVPLLGSQHVRGVLTVARLRGGAEFTAGDQEMAASFANQAGVALELAEARAEQQRTLMLEERERIAADLHDHVIQRLFAAGLSLNALAAALGPGRSAERLVDAVSVLDDTIGQIRDTIFQLHRMSSPQRSGVRNQLLDVVSDLAGALGFEPGVRFTGLLDSVVDAPLAEDLVAVLREALSNVARHASARTVEVEVVTRGDCLTLEVRDDGVGMGTTTRRSGLASMLRRAQRHGGDLTLTAREPSGTSLRWSASLS